MSQFNEENAAVIPYYVHEGEMVRMERLNKRWFAAFLITLVMLFATNIAWCVYEMSFETISYVQEAQTDKGDAAAMLTTGEGSVAFYGESQAGGQSEGEENGFLGERNEAMP